MKKIKNKFYLIFCLVCVFNSIIFSQNETNNWYFGQNAGLNFSTNPPTILTNGMLVTSEGCASISDGTGNLLFYTDGSTVYNNAHVMMANGNGLLGNSSTTQSGIIVKEPGNTNIFHIFTLGASGTGSLCFSTVNLNLAAGMGSVTVKNTLLSVGMTEKLTSVKHCNGKDVWVIAHENNSNNFKCYLVNTFGVNTIPVVTSVGTIYPNGNCWLGNLKASPSGRKLGLALSGASGSFELYDFDNLTGVVSNSINLGSFPSAYGCEFSPDESKFYGDREGGTNFLNLYQWDLCAGSPTAIISSQYSLSVPSQIMGMQLASDNKIYIARNSSSTLAVIHNPNSLAAACNYSHDGQSVAPKICRFNLPNFMMSYFKAAPLPFTYTVNCNFATFSLPGITNTLNAGCGNIITTPTNVIWSFGDILSGAANTSSLTNPNHTFSGSGSYSVQLIINSNCTADTLRSVIWINAAINLSVTGNFTICAGEKRTFTVSGASTYSWNNGASTNTTILSPTFTTIYSVSGTGTNSCSSSKLFTITVNKCTDVKKNTIEDEQLAIYPNPTKGYLVIETNVPITIIIYTTLGKIKEEYFFDTGIFNINISHFENGVYTVKSLSKKGVKISRLFKTD